jgi:hypothetical protein
VIACHLYRQLKFLVYFMYLNRVLSIVPPEKQKEPCNQALAV